MPSESVVAYQGQLPATSTLAYTVPAGLQGELTSVQLVNVTATAATARIDRVPSGGTDAATEEIYNGSVAADSTVDALSASVALNPGDTLYVSASAAATIDATLSVTLTDVD